MPASGSQPVIGQDSQRRRRLADAVGPCYSARGIAGELGLSVEEVATLVVRCGALCLTTSDHHAVFPAFQVHNGRIVRKLGPVLRTLRSGVDDPWTWALWLNSVPPLVDGDTPHPSRIAQLVAGDIDTVLRAAERSAWSWRS